MTRVYLHDRQTEVLQMLADGLNRTEIARQLCISPHTVRHTITNARNRYGVRSTAAVLVAALRAREIT